ncbi:MAG TPA: TIGR00730 family Rossman fold protein [Candidatus Eisenbacteria bacterium]|nr:TIGR00730 family Rossman fold protein [Candidatus Eisenbacteria bacterium]
MPEKDKDDPLPHPNQRVPLAYENKKFLNGPDGRILRILAEYQEPLSKFRRERIQDTIVFFGSARFRSRETTEAALEELRKTGSGDKSAEMQERMRRAESDVAMSRYYEDARRLAYLISQWTQTLSQPRHRFVVCTGGGPGIMEAANRGASEAGGKTIGLNIHLRYEQVPNPYITPELNFEFHYFFMRKLWFAYLAKALVVFPGGFGTFDEMFELLTLSQTAKLAKHISSVVYGRKYWDRVVNFQALVDAGTISREDLDLIHWADSPEEAFEFLRADLEHHHIERTGTLQQVPEIAKTRLYGK